MFDNFIDEFLLHPESQSFNSDYYKNATKEVSEIVKRIKILTINEKTFSIDSSYFGTILLPSYDMGEIHPLDLFAAHELVVFAHYIKNKDQYKIALDIGANIGLHSVVMSRLGYLVRAYEPDPETYKKLLETLKLNGCNEVVAINSAVSNYSGYTTFRRVLNNRTASSLDTSQKTVYGPYDEFKVKVIAIDDLVSDVDFIKLDVEGEEGAIIKSIAQLKCNQFTVLAEISNFESAKNIFNTCRIFDLSIYSQKISWSKVASLDDLPTTWREGSIILRKE